ncbi:MAG: hypothetical protein AB1452_14560 [Pseudomonadota bacterium]
MRFFAFTLALLFTPALAVTPEAEEFIAITKKLEPVQCEKRKLRREIALAEIEKRDADAKALKQRFAELNRNPEVAKLEKRLAELEPRLLDSRGRPRHPEDLDAISLQHRKAFYRCE